ncbi:MAG: ATP-binding cassette domain-containing protein, partial [Alphaproteobacteria bacterium]
MADAGTTTGSASGAGNAAPSPNTTPPAPTAESRITVRDLTMAYGSFVLMHDLNFSIRRGSIFVIMGGSGCGKTTLLKHMIGLVEPAKGEILYGEESFTRA